MVERLSVDIDWSVVSVDKSDGQTSVHHDQSKKIALNTSAKHLNERFHEVCNNFFNISRPKSMHFHHFLHCRHCLNLAGSGHW